MGVEWILDAHHQQYFGLRYYSSHTCLLLPESRLYYSCPLLLMVTGKCFPFTCMCVHVRVFLNLKSVHYTAQLHERTATNLICVGWSLTFICFVFCNLVNETKLDQIEFNVKMFIMQCGNETN